MRVYGPILLFLMLSGSDAALAQRESVPANCHGMITSTLASGRPHGDLSLCGKQLIPDIAAAIDAAPRRSPSDTAWFATLYEYAIRLRDPRIFDSALQVASDQRASANARTTALMIAVGEVQPGNFPTGFSRFERLLARGVSPTCSWSTISDSQYWADEGLPPDAARRALRVAKHMGVEQGQLQSLGRCAQLLLSTLVVPSAQEAASVTVTSLCDRRFQVHNPSDSELELHWAVEGTDETGELALAARSVRMIGTGERGALVLSWEGNEIARSNNLERACSP